MCSESIAGTFDLYDDGVMQQSVQQYGGHHRVAEHFGSFSEASIRGQDHGAFFVSGTDQLKEQIGAIFGQWQVTDLIDDEQYCTGVKTKFAGDLSGPMYRCQ